MTTPEQLAATVRAGLVVGRSFGDAEAYRALDSLLAAAQEYENCITWDTTCKNCAKLMDTNYAQYEELKGMRRERATRTSQEVELVRKAFKDQVTGWQRDLQAAEREVERLNHEAGALENEGRRLREALASIEVYYANLYVEGEINYQAVIVARGALGSESE